MKLNPSSALAGAALVLCAGCGETGARESPGNKRLGITEFQITEAAELTTIAVTDAMLPICKVADQCKDPPPANYPGTNPTLCTGPVNGGAFSCPVRTGTTQACNGTTSYGGLVVSEDFATWGWDQDVVIMCCTTGYAVKTCAAAPGPSQASPNCPITNPPTYCSSCGSSKNQCQACFSGIAYANGTAGPANCKLSSPPAGCNSNSTDSSGQPLQASLSCHDYCGDVTLVPMKQDTTPPVITLNGNASVTQECALPYSRLDMFSASNAC